MQVVWTEQAEHTLTRLLEYLEVTWGEAVARAFAERALAYVELVGRSPRLFPQCGIDDVRRCLIHPNTSLYYVVKTDKVVLLSFFDNRQDPDSLAQLIGGS